MKIVLFIHLHNRINTYTRYTSVMYFSIQKICINWTIKFFFFNFFVFFIINRITIKLYIFNFLGWFQISLYLINTVSSSIISQIFPQLSKYFMYALIWGKIMHEGLTILSSLYPIKYLRHVLLYLNLSDINIWFTYFDLQV